jgi:hypothetical protein
MFGVPTPNELAIKEKHPRASKNRKSLPPKGRSFKYYSTAGTTVEVDRKMTHKKRRCSSQQLPACTYLLTLKKILTN